MKKLIRKIQYMLLTEEEKFLVDNVKTHVKRLQKTDARFRVFYYKDHNRINSLRTVKKVCETPGFSFSIQRHTYKKVSVAIFKDFGYGSW